MHSSIPILLALVAQAASHGMVTSPATRQPGPAAAAVCGQTMVDHYKADGTSYPENLQRNPAWNGTGYNAALCNLWLCKGYQFGDNKAQVQSYAAGDVVDFAVNIRIPHKGFANVSVVDLAANQIVGEPLRVWADGYADPAKFPNLPRDQVEFNVTVPELGGRCAEAGACALQWYWFGQGQTYQSCVDFTQEAPAYAIRGRRRL
ncbi:hypothetical protein PspLS_04629 [Pyricularia sp. CBS 133598]|nr:hypothetical protein PspLS_04629 [Pyricularia sp. CBS 133598]